jgi:hypothetical protein
VDRTEVGSSRIVGQHWAIHVAHVISLPMNRHKDIQTVLEQLEAGKLKCMIVYRAADILME